MRLNGQREKRSLFAFDLPPEWASVLRKVWDQYYQDEHTPTSLVRHVVQEFVACHLTEEEMKADRVLPKRLPKLRPYLLLSAIDFDEKLGKRVSPESVCL